MPAEKETKPLKPSLGGKLGFGVVSGESEDRLSMKVVNEPFCKICKRGFLTQELFDTHLDGTTHIMKLCELSSAPVKLSGGGLPPTLAEHIASLLEPIQPRAPG